MANQGVVQQSVNRLEERILSQEVAIAKLDQIFSSNPKILFSHETSLMIQTKLVPDPDPDFNGLCWYQLQYRDSTLQLHRWSYNREKSRSELLFQNITHLKWEFWDSSKWRSDWPKNLTKTPAMIRLKGMRGKEKLEFAFLLDLSHPIHIERDA